jgi:2-polyprenyl-3-methyl-5-hydroxy-6-metoxy-1,4-benzoquinol methylase
VLIDRVAMAAAVEVNRPCFICGSDASEVRFHPDVRPWGYHDPFVLRRCSGCGLVFNSPRLPAGRLADLYRSNYYFFARPAGVELERIGGAYRRTISHLPAAGPRLLEVGSAKGYMLALLRRLGWRVTGVEIADSAAEHSRRVLGVDVFTGTLEEFRRRMSRTFDVVLAQDVLEHVPDPHGFLQALYESVAPGGRVIIDTPNVGGRSVSVVGERWRGFNPFHIYLFDRDTLTQAVSNAGFTVEIVGSYSDVPPEQSVLGAGGAPRRRPAWVTRTRSLLRSAVDRFLLPYHLWGVARQVRQATPLPLDPNCQGDNLVCIAVRPA